MVTKKTEAVPERVGNMVTFHPVINEKVCGELVKQAQDGQEDEVRYISNVVNIYQRLSSLILAATGY